MSESELSSSQRIALDHSWSWFVLHATQRLHMLNFWVVAAAFLTAGYVTALSNGSHELAVSVAIGGAFVSFCFWRLERRTRQLVRLGEAPLQEFQAFLAESTGRPEMRILDLAEKKKGRFASYGRVISAMQLGAIGAFLAAAIAAPFFDLA